MAEGRITKAQRFAELRDIVVNVDSEDSPLVAFIDHEVDLLSRKGDTKGTKTKNQVLNDGIKEGIVSTLVASDTPMSATDIATEGGYTVQKITALLKQLVEDSAIKRTEVKGKAYFEA